MNLMKWSIVVLFITLSGCAGAKMGSNGYRVPAASADIPFTITINKDAKFGIIVPVLVLNETTGSSLQNDPNGKMIASVYFQKGKVVNRPWWGKPSCGFDIASNVKFWNDQKIAAKTQFEVNEKLVTAYVVANVPTNEEPATVYGDGSRSYEDVARQTRPVTFSCTDGEGKIVDYDSDDARAAYGKLLSFSPRSQ